MVSPPATAESLYEPTVHTAFDQLMDMMMHSVPEEPDMSSGGGGDQNQSYCRLFQTGLLRLNSKHAETEHANMEEAQGLAADVTDFSAVWF